MVDADRETVLRSMVDAVPDGTTDQGS